MTVVKVQTPLATNDPNPKALVYAEGRVGVCQQYVPVSVWQRVRRAGGKAFFEAKWRTNH